MSNTKVNNSSDEITQINNDFNHLKLIDSQTSADIFWLGYCYEYGIGVEKDKNKAFIHYQKSAEMNHPNGMYQVGCYYFLGIGVEKDIHKAFMYYLKSAEAGDSMGIWKTAICYYYGIGVEKSKDKYNEWIKKDPANITTTYRNDGFNFNSEIRQNLISTFPLNMSFPSGRIPKYGECTHCTEYNTQKAWCQTCDPDITIQEWTSGNKDIDECIKWFQLRTNEYERMIEWIPFDRLGNIKKIGEGGCGTVFSATWLDGMRKISRDQDNCTKTRESFNAVALKTLSGSRKNPRDFLKEFDSHMKCNCNQFDTLLIYGLTQNTETNEYLMVFQYADNGSLNKFLRKSFKDLTWQTKLKLLKDISYNLYSIHYSGYIHADFHSGNILQDEVISKNMKSYISDLGLSKKKDENDSEGNIYGVMPYVAPEILSGKKFTQAADIYGFGVIMSEMSTGRRPFDGYQFDFELAVKICRGLRPDFAPGTPDCYIEFAMNCMDSDPHKRPKAFDVDEKLRYWNERMENSDDANEIKKQFLDADKIVKELPVILPQHPDHMYTSKIINTQRISDAIKATLTSIPIDPVEVPTD